ncbi:MAG: extracellular solute-binding protein [Phycisphaera sp.]|nr:extracellular solute-binding protein [Phycisphaera sp.]
MKYLFTAVAALLIFASLAVKLSMPSTGTAVPVIYWVTDPNPARIEQAAGFSAWLIKAGHGERVTFTRVDDVSRFQKRRWSDNLIAAMRSTNAAGPKLWDKNLQPLAVKEQDLPLTISYPPVDLRLDYANSANEKKLIQGVSGVGSEISDLNSNTLHFSQAVGICDDVTQRALELGFDPGQTHPAIVPDLTVNGRQYAFPCNVSVGLYFVNKKTFEKYGVEVPPARWDTQTYERIGKQLVDAANPPGQRRTVFFADEVRSIDLYRSLGLSSFNETLTRCTINDPRFVQAIKLKYKWMYVDHLIPSLAERTGFDTQTGFGGPKLQLFNSNNYAMVTGGRWLLVQLRKFGDLDMSISEYPYFPGGMPNTTFYTRCAAVYAGAEQRDKAELFLAYLASADYNNQIVADADALPPNPKYADSEAFRNPPDHPTEHGIHQPFYEAAKNIAIAVPACPFVLKSVASRHINEAEDAFMNNRLTAEQAAEQAGRRVNEEIQRTLKEQPKLVPDYERRLELQKKIDAYRLANKPVPVEWIDNPFHRKWYAFNHWLAEEGGTK